MKKYLAMLLSMVLFLSVVPVNGLAVETDGGLIAEISAEDEAAFSLSKKTGEVMVNNGLIEAVSSENIGFVINFNEPVVVEDLDMLLRYSFKVESKGTLKYVSMRVYGENSSLCQTGYMGKEPESGKWYDGEAVLEDIPYRLGSAPLMPGDKIKRIRIDAVNETGEEAKVFIKSFSFYHPQQESILSEGQKEMDRAETAVQSAKPGDVIILKNGTYRNVSMIFRGKGTADKPITLKAQTPGGVKITGSSRMIIGGEYVTVDGLLFEGGDKNKAIIFAPLSIGCRLTNTAMVNWNKPNKEDVTKWIQIYGTYNRVDHCFFRGKNTQGQLLEVMRSLNEEQHNLIDNNYFGYYEQGIKNGCETVRLCNTTDTSANCFSVVQNNFFDNCSGENEIISNKSNDNRFINNTFFDSKGGLSLRIGKRCLVEGNIFAGGKNDYSGVTGVGIMDEDHTVKNNYFYNITPSSYAIALTNGTDPNPAAYELVKNAKVEQNTLINCGTGISVGTFSYRTDAEFPRIYPPEGNVTDNYLFNNYETYRAFSLDDPKTTKVTYSNNIVTGNTAYQTAGILQREMELEKKENGLYFPKENIGADYEVVSKAYTSPMQFLPEWIQSKILSGDPDYAVNELSMEIEKKDEIVLLELNNNKAYNYLCGTEVIDENSEITPIEQDGRTLVPLRFISETFGFEVVWFETEQKVKLKKDQGVNYVEFFIGSDKMTKNGIESQLDVPAMLLYDRTYIPLRAAVEAISKTVHWDDRGYILITANEKLQVDKAYFDKTIALLQ